MVAPYLSKKYTLSFAYGSSTGLDEALFDQYFTRKFQLSFDDPTEGAQIRMKEILKQVNPDLIYLNKCLSVPILQAIVDSKIPCIRMVHDHEVYCMRRYKYFPVSRRICHKKAGPCCIVPCLAFIQRDREKGEFGLRWVSYTQKQTLIHLDQQLAAFFVISHYMHNELKLQGYEEKKIHLFPPMPITIPNPAPSAFGPENVILFIGQIIRGKGLDCLIRALAQIKTPFCLIVCGSGYYTDYCQQLAKDLGIATSVEFRGFIPHEMLPDLFTNATLVAVPSVWPEPFASVGLEVMRYGLPVVAFDSGGISDWLKNNYNGLLIPWMDISAMAQSIDWLLNHKEEARRMGENGQHFVREKYDFGHYLQNMQRVFNILINSEQKI